MSGGAAFDHRPHQGAVFTGLALARDYPYTRGSRLAFAGELYPIVLLRQGTGTGDDKELNPAVAAAAVVTYRGRGPGGKWGYRLELGTGIVYAPLHPVPSGGTHFNFYDQGGFAVTLDRAPGHALSIGYRLVHISNLSLFPGRDNPGISFHALAVAMEWLR